MLSIPFLLYLYVALILPFMSNGNGRSSRIHPMFAALFVVFRAGWQMPAMNPSVVCKLCAAADCANSLPAVPNVTATSGVTITSRNECCENRRKMLVCFSPFLVIRTTPRLFPARHGWQCAADKRPRTHRSGCIPPRFFCHDRRQANPPDALQSPDRHRAYRYFWL